MSELAIKLPIRPNQTEFNLRRWEELCADPFLATLEQRVETDRHGNVIMTPPPQNPHSIRQTEISFLLRTKMTGGRVQVEVPISTSDGVKGCDVTWASPERYDAIYDERAHTGAPDICVEVLSPSNTPEEMADKKALYFDAGASEVWLCRDNGQMEFYTDVESKPQPSSSLCPEFPQSIE